MASPIATFKGHLPGSEPDVKIYTPYRLFLLHSHVLRLCSKWFATSMSEVWWEDEDCIDDYRYCYGFDCDKDGVSTLIPRLEERNNPHRQEIALRGTSQNEETMSDPEDIEDLCTTYEDMFKSFYRLPVLLPDATRSENLISIANQFEALGSVKDTINSCILNWGDLEEQIERNPIEFIIIGYKLESYRIFKDAFVHIVGRQSGKSNSALWWDSSNLIIPAPVTRMIVSEYVKLNQLMSDAMRKVLRYSSSYDDDSDKLKVARCFVAHGSHGNEGALSREILNVPLSIDAKSAIREIFLPLSKNNLSSKIDEAYLTCAQVSEDEVPWKKN